VAAEQLFIAIIAMLVGARVLGEVFQRLKQPAIVGELLAGIIIGPSILGLVSFSKDYSFLSDISVFFLMFLAGLEMDPRELRKAGKQAIIVSVFAFVTPLLAGYYTGTLFGLASTQAWFMGLLLSITAVPVSAIILMQLGVLNTRLGNTVMAAAVINDIMSLVALSIIIQAAHSTAVGGGHISYIDLWLSIVKITLFVSAIILFYLIFGMKTSAGNALLQKVSPLFRVLHTREAGFSLLLIAAIGISLAASNMGLHFIIGTFFAGLVANKQIIGKENFSKFHGIVSAITFGFFGPIFFGLIGVEINLQAISGLLPLFGALLAVAIVAKIGGAYLGVRIARFSGQAGLALAFLMNGRGAVELAIAAIGYAAGIIDTSLFSIAVAIGFVTTLITPLTARPLVAAAKAKHLQALEVPSEQS
jgi:Kef-type K+ transport system membrane component KefB